MRNFKIHFLFEGEEYKADVDKIPFFNSLPVQFHVYNVTPEIINIPNPYFFIHEPKSEQFTFALYNHSTDLPGKMIKAIKDYCLENGISLTK